MAEFITELQVNISNSLFNSTTFQKNFTRKYINMRWPQEKTLGFISSSHIILFQIYNIHFHTFKYRNNTSFNLKIINYTLSSDGQRYKYWNVAVMFLENLGPKTSLSVPNWWRDCRTIESITYNPGTLYSGLHYKDKDAKLIQEKQNHNLMPNNLSFMWINSVYPMTVSI